MKSVQWRNKALRQLRRIKSKEERIKITSAVRALEDFPDCQGVKKLKHRDDYRLRVGRWRIIFTEHLEIILIEEVKKRNERTYT
jgi:mRNA-degrading endonuclease RelE of RelBE toxin-antitoxin system